MKDSADQGGCCPPRHILWKLNSIIALLFIQNISPFLKPFHHFVLCISAPPKKHNLIPRFSRLKVPEAGCTFWRYFDVIGSIWQSSFPIWSTAAGYGESCVWFQPVRNREIFWMNNNINNTITELLLYTLSLVDRWVKMRV